MLIDIDLHAISADKTVVVANNRQVLAFKKTWQQQKPNSQLATILSWQQYLQHTWRQIEPNQKARFISSIESRMLIKKSISDLGQIADNGLIDAVVKNYQYCQTYLISVGELRQSYSDISALFVDWIEDYQRCKLRLNLVDIFDLSALILKNNSNISSPYIYGFKTLTPEQSLLLTFIKAKTLNPNQTTKKCINKAFKTTFDEILAAAIWAKKRNQTNPQQQIAIVVPQLNELHYLIKFIFNEVFADDLLETQQKSYNISLGLPLSEYPLIQQQLGLLELSHQITQNRIQTSTFKQIVGSPYIAAAHQEKSARALLVNRVLSLSKVHFKLDEIQQFLSACPILEAIIKQFSQTENQQKQSHDYWLLEFNKILQDWGFASDRTLLSVEYQLLNKYQQASLGFNQLAEFQPKIHIANAIDDLKNWLSQVMFQPQSSNASVHILGALEAEGLFFDHAWVLGMTRDFLPAALNLPHFIDATICSKHQVLHSNYALLAQDAIGTMHSLEALADEVIFSYGKIYSDHKQQSCVLLPFGSKIHTVPHKFDTIKYQLLDDSKAPTFTDSKVKNGVSVLKSQMQCAFRGFTHRLNIRPFDPPHIGINRKQQGLILHKVLELIYQEISTQSALLACNDKDLTRLIQEKITKVLADYPASGFILTEHNRLSALLHQFIQAEKQRNYFEVISTEKMVAANIGGLCFNTRLDRIDQIENGEQIIFDYKIGATSPSQWCGETIKEPQLPIYTLCNNADGIAFIQLSADQIHYKSLTKSKNILPQQSKRNSCQNWHEQTLIWQQKLTEASQDFQQGKSAVLPNKGACDYCQYDSLCRIQK